MASQEDLLDKPAEQPEDGPTVLSANPLEHPPSATPAKQSEEAKPDPLLEAQRSGMLAFDDLRKALVEITTDATNTSINVLIYFDEAHELTTTTTQPLYDILLSVLCDYTGRALFAVFLSTTTNITRFAPPREVLRSMRALDSKYHNAPITEVPFDCDPDICVAQDTYTRKEVAEPRFMARFGRPLCVYPISLPGLMCSDERCASYWTWFKQIKEIDESKAIPDFMLTLRAKLINRDPSLGRSESFKSWGDSACLAVADVRLCLAYEPNILAAHSTDVNKPAELVASHMRVAYSVPKHRRYMRSGYPSEPLLAEVCTEVPLQMSSLLTPFRRQHSSFILGGTHGRSSKLSTIT